MAIIDVKVGDSVRFAKTVSESDVYLYAGITGDFSSNHVNDEVMRRSPFGRRIAHGALVVGFFSTASTMITERSLARGVASTPVSLGYDRIRFLKPVFFGDTVTVTYAISDIDLPRQRTRSTIEARNQHGDLVAVGEHILKWVPNGANAESDAAG
jgi:acyl dehydratase